MYPSGPSIITPDVPVPPPRVQTVQPQRLDTEGPSFKLRPRGKKTTIPLFSLTAQFQKTRESNVVTHKISGVSQEYIHLIKGPERNFWEISFANELGQLSKGIRMVKGANTVIFIPKSQVPKDKELTYGKRVCKVKS